MHRDLVVLLVALAPGLLADDPDAGAHARPRLSRFLADDELEPGHGLEAALEGLAGLDEVVHGHVVHGLAGDDGVVGGALEEGRLGKVEEDRVGVQAAHLLDELRRAPLDLVEGRIVWIIHFWGEVF